MNHKAVLTIIIFSLMIASYSLITSFSHTNRKLPISKSELSQATFDFTVDRGDHPNKQFILALSGGGSRAAYYITSEDGESSIYGRT